MRFPQPQFDDLILAFCDIDLGLRRARIVTATALGGIDR
jgi:hypothetical protein